MKSQHLSAAIAGFLLAVSTTANAEVPPLRLPAQIMSARPGALGGAFTAVADDQNALFFNPAGLSYIDSTFVGILDLETSGSVGSGGIGELLDDVTNVPNKAKAIFASGDTSQKLDNFTSFGKLVSSRTLSFKFQNQSYLVKKRWGFAITGLAGVGLGVHANLLPDVIDLGVLGDVDFRFGYAHPLLDGKVSIGASPYSRVRAQGGRANLSLNDAFNAKEVLQKDLMFAGHGFGLDLGLMIKPVETMSPTFGLAILNVGDTRFRVDKNPLLGVIRDAIKDEKVGPPDSIKQVVNAGFSVTPVDGPGFVRVSGELREINRPSAAELKPAGAVEAGFRSNYIRTLASAGWGNGGWSAGFELRAFVKLRFATYIEPNLFFDRVKNQRVWVLSAGL